MVPVGYPDREGSQPRKKQHKSLTTYI
jgi:hypothetical protein